jgi:adenylate cyclase
MPYTLTSVEGGQSYDLKMGGALVVGRALTSDIPVFDPTISRRHAELVHDEHGVELRDLGSSNGTFVNGTKVEHTRLQPGDVIVFGKVAFRLTERTQTPTTAGTRSSGAGPAAAGADTLSSAARGSPAITGPIGADAASAPRTTPIGNAAIRGAGTIVRQLRVPESGSQGLAAALRGKSTATGGRRTPDVAQSTDTGNRANQERNAQKLGLLLEVSKGLTRIADIGPLLDKIAGFCLQIFDVDYVSVLLADERGEQVPKVARDRQGAAPQRSVPQSIVRTVVQDKVAILSDNAPEDVRFGGESILVQRVRSTMCAPLVGSEGRVLGVLYVDNVTSTHRVDEEDLEFLAAFASIAAVAIDNGQFSERIRHELLVRSNFERYFAPNLAARIAESPGAVRLGGDKRPVAVLFSDIRGFTALSESMNPDDMASLLTEYFTEMVECVFRHGGTLDKFMGDAVMAQWGAPIGTPEDADRAVQAAVEMMRALDALNTKWRGVGRPELGIGIGLSYGEAFAGNIGSERRLEFTVIGDTVNTASRLCAVAEAGEILLSDEIRRALRRPPVLEERAPLELKGKAHPVPVYHVVRQ